MKSVEQRIKERAQIFVADNIRKLNGIPAAKALVIVEAAMLIGAGIAYEAEADEALKGAGIAYEAEADEALKNVG